MDRPTIALVGGTGFIGARLVAALVRAGYPVRLAARRRERARHLATMSVEVVELDRFDAASLARVVAGAGVAINLVGTLHGGRGTPYGEGFRQLHVALPGALAAACVEAGVAQLVQVSALGADSHGPSMYQRSKGDGEAALHAAAAASGGALAVTVLRPSVVFGPGDAFLTTFARLQRLLPVLPLAMPDAQFQPVYVGDVAQALLAVAGNRAAYGRTYELGGPRVYTLEQLVRYCGALVGRQARIIRLPDALARLQASVFEHLPGEPVITRDNLASMRVPNVLSGPLAPELGVRPASLEGVAPGYLSAGGTRYDAWRSRR
ncbi:complex I NDUFA9 subunit family protein [Burkholderia plantarii]|uniref:complex I NDUFA9 subunit family protein n=1 Tax=Burkholderia plantarii TaxID=41899 RepID=UPI0018DE652E|nr:complex I NDUFA9 subunit family protein [Burkholderia plantarii]MBI0327062.1 complex I NDUFA9 subunit family protein [Burkholderia plantarii]